MEREFVQRGGLGEERMKSKQIRERDRERKRMSQTTDE